MSDFTLDPEAALALGIIVGLLSTCVQSVGLTLQRKSHMLEDEKEDDYARRPPYKRRRWQVGMLLFLLANIIGSTIQIVSLPLPLLSTLQASGLVFNSILATLLLKEPWTRRSLCGTFLVATGAVLVSYFAAMPEPSHNLGQLLVLLGKPNFLVWFILSLAFALLVIVVTFTLRKCISSHRSESPRVLLVNGMIFGLVSGIFSAHALLLAKSAVELIVRSISDNKNQFKSWQPWVLVLAFLILSLSQLYYLHLGLKLISTSILYPFVFCVYNIVAILDGLIYFQQMSRLPTLSAGLISLGTVFLLAGVLALSWRLQDDEYEEHHAVKPEIPQTVLAPGMGFVGDPESESYDSESVHTDDEPDSEGELGEHTELIRKSLKRSRTMTNKIPHVVPGHPQVHTNKRRHRAATLREVKDIWDALGDGDHYGTFDRRPSSSASIPARVETAEHERQRRRRRSSAGRSLEQEVLSERSPSPGAGLSRASTMPAHLTRVRRRRRSTRQGSALFSDLLRSDWWLFKRKSTDHDDEPPSPSHNRHGRDSEA